MVTAYIDESGRRRADDACVYALAAVLIDDEHHDPVAEALRDLRYGRNQVIHWRDERQERRALIVKALAELPIHGIVTVNVYENTANTERARRFCLRRLLPELADRGVEAAVFEARQENQNHRDRSVVTALRKAREIPTTMTVDWSPPTLPPLWAADVVAGVVTWWLGGEGAYFDRLAARIDLIDP